MKNEIKLNWVSIEERVPQSYSERTQLYIDCVVYISNSEYPKGGIIDTCLWDVTNECWKPEARSEWLLQGSYKITHFIDDVNISHYHRAKYKTIPKDRDIVIVAICDFFEFQRLKSDIEKKYKAFDLTRIESALKHNDIVADIVYFSEKADLMPFASLMNTMLANKNALKFARRIGCVENVYDITEKVEFADRFKQHVLNEYNAIIGNQVNKAIGSLNEQKMELMIDRKLLAKNSINENQVLAFFHRLVSSQVFSEPTERSNRNYNLAKYFLKSHFGLDWDEALYDNGYEYELRCVLEREKKGKRHTIR